MPRDSYTREKFGVAVDNLASGTGSIFDRILDAYMSFHPLQERDFSKAEDGERYRKIMDRLTSVKDGNSDNGYVKNTLAAMSEETAVSIAEDIVALDHSLRR